MPDLDVLLDFDSLVLNKQKSIEDQTADKVAELQSYANLKRIKSIHDKDTMQLEGDSESTRIAGYDAAEVLDGVAEGFIPRRKIEQDKAVIAAMRGIPVDEISDADVNAAGLKGLSEFKQSLGFDEVNPDKAAYVYEVPTGEDSKLKGDTRNISTLYDMEGRNIADQFNNPTDNMAYAAPWNRRQVLQDQKKRDVLLKRVQADREAKGEKFNGGFSVKTGDPEIQAQPNGLYSFAGHADLNQLQLEKFGALIQAKDNAAKHSWTDGSWYKEVVPRLLSGIGNVFLDAKEAVMVNGMVSGNESLSDKIGLYNEHLNQWGNGRPQDQITPEEIYRYNILNQTAANELTAGDKEFLKSYKGRVIQGKLNDIDQEHTDLRALDRSRQKVNSITNRVKDEAFSIEWKDLYRQKEYGNMALHALTNLNYIPMAAESLAFSAVLANPYTTVPAMMGMISNGVYRNERSFKKEHGRDMTEEEAQANYFWTTVGSLAEKFGADYIFKGIPGSKTFLRKQLQVMPTSLKAILKLPEVVALEGSQGAVTAYSEQKAVGKEVDQYQVLYGALMEAGGALGQVGAVKAGQAPKQIMSAKVHGVNPEKVDEYTAKAKHWSTLQADENVTEKQAGQLDKRMSKLQDTLLSARDKALRVKSDVSLRKIDATLKKYFPDVNLEEHTQALKDKITDKQKKQKDKAATREARKEELRESIQTRETKEKTDTAEKEAGAQQEIESLNLLATDLTERINTFKAHALDKTTGESLAGLEGTARQKQGLATIYLGRALAKATTARTGLLKKSNLTAEEEAFVKSVDKLIAPFKEGKLNTALTNTHKNLGSAAATDDFLHSIDPALLSMDDLVALGQEEEKATQAKDIQQVKRVKQKVKLAKINKELKSLNPSSESNKDTKVAGAKSLAEVANDVLGETAGSLQDYVTRASESPKDFLQTYGASFVGFVEQRVAKAKQFEKWFRESYEGGSTIYFKNENGKQVRLAEKDVPRDEAGKVILGDNIKFIDARSGKLVKQLNLEAQQAAITQKLVKDTLNARGVQVKELADVTKAVEDIQKTVTTHVGYGTADDIGKKEKVHTVTREGKLPEWAGTLVDKVDNVLKVSPRLLTKYAHVKGQSALDNFLFPFTNRTGFIASPAELKKLMESAHSYNTETETWEFDPKKFINGLVYLYLEEAYPDNGDQEITEAEVSTFVNQARPAIAQTVHNLTTAAHSVFATEGTAKQQELQDALIQAQNAPDGKGIAHLYTIMSALPGKEEGKAVEAEAQALVNTAFWALNRNKAYTAGELNTVIQVAGQRRGKKKEAPQREVPPEGTVPVEKPVKVEDTVSEDTRQSVQADSDVPIDDVPVNEVEGQDRAIEDQEPTGDFIGSDPDEEAPNIPDDFDPDTDFVYQEDTVPTDDIFAAIENTKAPQDIDEPVEVPLLDTDPESETLFDKSRPTKKVNPAADEQSFDDTFGNPETVADAFFQEPEKVPAPKAAETEKENTGTPLVEGEHYESRYDSENPSDRERITVRNQTVTRKSGRPATIPHKYLPKIKAKATSLYHWFDTRVLLVAQGLTGETLKTAYEKQMTTVLQKYFGGNLPGQRTDPNVKITAHTKGQIELFASMYADVKYAFQHHVRPAYSAVAPKGAAYTKSAIDILYDSKRIQKKDGSFVEGQGTQAAPRELELPETVLMAITESLLQFLKNDAASFVNPDAAMVKRMLYGNQKAALTADEFDAIGKTGAIPVTYIASALGQTIAGRLRLTQEKFEKGHALGSDPAAAAEYEALMKFMRARETLFNTDELEASLGAIAVEIGSHITVETDEESEAPTNLFYMASYRWTFEEGFKSLRRYNKTTDKEGEIESHRTEVVFVSSMERKDGTRYLHPGWSGHSPELIAGFDDFANALHARAVNTNSYYTAPVADEHLMTKAKKSLFELPERIRKFLKNKSSQPWIMDQALGNLFLAMDDKTRMFLTDHKDVSKSPLKYMENDKSGYQAKERNLQHIKDFFMRHLGQAYQTPIYFQYSPQNQHRVFMKSATINMQSSKEHRELFLAMDRAHYKKTGEIRPNMATVNDERSLNLFKAAILEGFDKDPDKQNIDSLDQAFRKILDDTDVQAILPLIQKMKSINTTPVSAAEQAKFNVALRSIQSTYKSYFPLLTALSGLADFADSKGKPFDTTIILEADGKTNGGMFGKFQFYHGDATGNMTTEDDHLNNLQRIKDGLRRGGVVFKEDEQSHDRLATTPGFHDEYQTLAQHFVRMAQRLIASNGADDIVYEIGKSLDEDELKGKLWEAFKDYKQILGAKSLNTLSSPMTVDGAISKFARNLAKPINMKGSYTAGTNTLARETATNTLEEIYRNFAAFQAEYDTLKALPNSKEEIGRLVQTIREYSLSIHQLLQIVNTDKNKVPIHRIVDGEIIFVTHNTRLLPEHVLPLNPRNIQRKLNRALAVTEGKNPNYQTLDLNAAVEQLEKPADYTSIDQMILTRVQSVYKGYIETAVENEYSEMYEKRDVFLDGYDWMMSLFQVDLDIRVKNYMKRHGISKRTSLTEEEIIRLIKQSKTYPSFPLPVSTQAERDASREGNTLPSSDRIDMVKHGRSEGAPISSAIKKKALPLAEGDTVDPEHTVDVSSVTVASSNKVMLSPGGSGMVRNIQNEDSFTVLVPLEGHDALILYDATKGTISQVEDINKIYNDTFLGVNQDFKLIREMQKELQSRVNYMQNTVFGKGHEREFKKYMLEVRKHYAIHARRGIANTTDADPNELFKTAMLDQTAPALITGHAEGASHNYMDTVTEHADYVDQIDKEIFDSIDAERTKQMFLPDMTVADDQKNNQTYEERRDPKTQSSVEEYAEQQTSLIYEATGTKRSIMSIFAKLMDSATHTFSRTAATDMEDEVNNHLSMVLDTIIGTAADTLETVKISVKEGLYYAAGHYSPAANVVETAYAATLNKAYVHQSPQEVYVHELLHAVTTRALNALPAYQRKMEKIYNHLKTHDAISYKMFLNYDDQGNIMYLTDEATEIQVAKLLFAQVFSDRQNPSKAWNELLTYAVTNRNFYKSLEDLPPLVDKWFEGKGLADGIFNFFHKLISELSRQLKQKNPPANMAFQLIGISKDLMEISENKKGDVYEQYKLEGYRKYLEKGNSGLRRFFKQHVHYNTMKVADWTLEKSFDTSEKLQSTSKLGTAMFGAVGMMAFPFTRSAYIHANDLAGNNAAIMDQIYQATERSPILKVAYKGIQAATYSFRKKPTSYSQLRDRSNQLIDQLQQEAYEGGVTHLMQSFKQGYENLSEHAKHSLTTTLLRTDLQSLVGTFSETEILDLMDSSTSRQMRIQSLMQDLNLTKSSQVYTQFEQMATAMLTGQTHYTNIARNVETVDRWYHFADGSETRMKKADMLVSLISLDRAPTEARKQAAEVMHKEVSLDAKHNGFVALLQTSRDITQKSRKELFKSNPYSYEKGYIPTRQTGSNDLTLAPVTDEAIMNKKGFQMVSTVAKVDVSGANAPYAIYLKKDVPDIKRVRQIFSLKNSKRKGTSVSDIIYRNQTDPSPVQMHKILDEFTQRQVRQEMQYSREATVRPIVNRQGKIIDYTVHMPTAAKEALLQQDLDPAALVASMYSAHSTKKNTPKVNSMLISLMHDRYNQLKDSRADSYWIDILDPKNRDDYYYILPKETRQMVKSLAYAEDAHTPHFYIERPYVNLFYGYSEMSLSNAWGIKDSRVIQNYVRKFEDFIADFTNVVSSNIVIRTPAVSIDNALANFNTQVTLGIPISYILKSQHNVINELTSYVDFGKELQDLKWQQRSNATVDPKKERRITWLQRRLEASFIHPFMTEGIYNALTEDLDISNKAYRNKLIQSLSDKWDDKIGKKTVAGKLAREAFMTSTTQSYKEALFALRAGDIMAKISTYQWFTEHEKWDHNKAWELTDETFVNYNVATDRLSQYLTRMGGVYFIKYWFGAQRAAWNLLKMKPLSVTMSMAAKVFLDLPVKTLVNSSWIAGRFLPSNVFNMGIFKEVLMPPGLELLKPSNLNGLSGAAVAGFAGMQAAKYVKNKKPSTP